MTRSSVPHKAIEARKPWRKKRALPRTFFGSYTSRLQALAERHNVKPHLLNSMIEQAFGTSDAPPEDPAIKGALMKLAQLKIGPSELNWLFECHVVPETELE